MKLKTTQLIYRFGIQKQAWIQAAFAIPCDCHTLWTVGGWLLSQNKTQWSTSEYIPHVSQNQERYIVRYHLNPISWSSCVERGEHPIYKYRMVLVTLFYFGKTGSFNHKEHEKEESVENNSKTRVIKGKWAKAKNGGGQRTRPCHLSSNLALCKLIVLSNSLTIGCELV